MSPVHKFFICESLFERCLKPKLTWNSRLLGSIVEYLKKALNLIDSSKSHYNFKGLESKSVSKVSFLSLPLGIGIKFSKDLTSDIFIATWDP